MLFPQQESFVQKVNHILEVFHQSDGQIRPHFHVTGPSGSGKSYLINKVAKFSNIPFMEINAAGLTAEGMSGNSLSKALRKLREHWNTPNIIFVDEFDKLFQRNGEKTEDFRVMVQDEFLTALESKYTSIFTDYGKYEPVVIENSLFVFAGAYSNQKITTIGELKDAGLRTEFIGRVPLILSTEEVPLEELKKRITSVDLYDKYTKLMFSHLDKRKYQSENQKAINWIIKRIEEQSKETPIGIRLLNSTIHQYFMKDI